MPGSGKWNWLLSSKRTLSERWVCAMPTMSSSFFVDVCTIKDIKPMTGSNGSSTATSRQFLPTIFDDHCHFS